MKKLGNGSNGRLAAGVAVTAAMLVPLAVFGAPALARSTSAASPNHSGSAQYQYRVTICHRTGSKKHPAHTITVSSAAVAAHLRHGDHLGACTSSEPAKGHGATPGAPTTPGAPSQGHGNGNGNGNANGHHK